MATRAETETKPDALRREYAAWSKAQGLSLGIADEHIFDETLTEARRTVGSGFFKTMGRSC